MKRAKLFLCCAVFAVVSLVAAQGGVTSKYPRPSHKITESSLMADMDARIPIVILINKTGKTLTKYTQLNVRADDEYGIMSHGQGALRNGQQRIIVPYIRSGGTVRMVYQLEGRRPTSWSSEVPLRAGVPLVLTFYPNDKVTANAPYKELK